MATYVYDGRYLYSDTLVTVSDEVNGKMMSHQVCDDSSKILLDKDYNFTATSAEDPIRAVATLGSIRHQTELLRLLINTDVTIQQLVKILRLTDKKEWFTDIRYLLIDSSGDLNRISINSGGVIYVSCWDRQKTLSKGKVVIEGTGGWVEELINNCSDETLTGLETIIFIQNYYQDVAGPIDRLCLENFKIERINPTAKERLQIFNAAKRKLKFNNNYKEPELLQIKEG